MKVVIELSDEESKKLERLAEHLFVDNQVASEIRYAHNGYKRLSWAGLTPGLKRHWIRHAALQECSDFYEDLHNA